MYSRLKPNMLKPNMLYPNVLYPDEEAMTYLAQKLIHQREYLLHQSVLLQIVKDLLHPGVLSQTLTLRKS